VPEREDPNRRITKAERRDEARRKREEIQRKMAKQRRRRLLGGVALVVAAGLVVALVVLQPFAGKDATQAQASDLLKQAPAAAKAAACTDVKTIQAYDNISDPQDPKYVDQAHIGTTAQFPTPPKLSTYPSVPPTSGPHAALPPDGAGPLPAGVYTKPPDIYQAIHSLEHGATIVWYDPTTSGAALSELTSFYDRKVSAAAIGQDRVIIAPYSYPDQGTAGQLPDGVGMALVAWHRMQTCSSVSLPVAFAFTSKYSAPPAAGQTYAGEAPEAGAVL
jgi:hypothetical protein